MRYYGPDSAGGANSAPQTSWLDFEERKGSGKGKGKGSEGKRREGKEKGTTGREGRGKERKRKGRKKEGRREREEFCAVDTLNQVWCSYTG